MTFEERKQRLYEQAGLASPTPEEVLRVMRDGGLQLCEYASAKHVSGACGSDEERNYAYHLYYGELKEAIREAAREAARFHHGDGRVPLDK